MVSRTIDKEVTGGKNAAEQNNKQHKENTAEYRRKQNNKIFKIMYSIMSIWALLSPQGEYKRRRGVCERLWAGYDEATRQRVYEALSAAKEEGRWINPNPYFAIEDTALAEQRKRRTQTLSFNEYYIRYGTTEEKDGWKMENPTGQKVIYVKVG